MTRAPLRRRLACAVVGHAYLVAPQEAADEAPHWPCRRCGRKRYRRPPDFLDGADGVSQFGGGH